MSLKTRGNPGNRCSEHWNLLEETEKAGLLRLTKLVEQAFHVRVAYVALADPDSRAVTRIGSGEEHWEGLDRYPLTTAIAEPEFISGDIRFAAAAPLRTSNGLDLGKLVIADIEPKPEFSQKDHDALAELAGVIGGSMERRVMERSLQEAEHRFRSMANAAPVMIIYSGVDGGSSFVNKAWVDFTGRDFAEEPGEGFSDTCHPDYRKGVLRSYWDAFQERRPLMVEFPMRRHDGEYRWMKVRGMPRFLDNGIYAGYLGYFIDTTDRQSAIAELNKQILCTAAVAEAAGVFHLTLDPDGRIEHVSPLCQRTSRRHPGLMCGRLLWESCDAAIPGKAAVSDAIHRVISSRATVHTEVSYSSPSGAGPVKLRWTFTPILSERNELIAIAAVALELSGGRRSSSACAHLRCACSRPASHTKIAHLSLAERR